MNLTNKRKIFINAALVGFMVALAEEEEDNEGRQQRGIRRRKCWVKQYLQQRNGRGKHANFENLTKNPTHFFANFHMSFDTFQSLFSLLEPHLLPRRISRGNDFIRVELKFAAVLEYFALGGLQRDVSFSYRISKQHFGLLVAAVCEAIAQELGWEIPQWEKYAVLGSALDSEKTWNLPNCVGAIGGKLLGVGPPMKNREEMSCIPIFAVCDPSLRFTYLDVGDILRANDPDLFVKSNLGKAILTESLYFPEDSCVNGSPMTYYVVSGDDTFPLIKRIMKPFESKSISREEQHFNERIHQASSCIDKAFGLLSANWTVMRRQAMCRPERAKQIARACCLLHNYLLRTKPKDYTDWLPENNEAMIPINSIITPGGNEDYPKLVRDSIKNSLIVRKEMGQASLQAHKHA
ncbi:hypothetical protein KR059_001437 [Drosophila kikkawai]|nr:hypothetical protein KR059_001437 [Drosophila kikkawai]